MNEKDILDNQLNKDAEDKKATSKEKRIKNCSEMDKEELNKLREKLKNDELMKRFDPNYEPFIDIEQIVKLNKK